MANLQVRVTPRADRDAILRLESGVLHLRVTASPVDGAANRAVIALVAESLGIPKSAIDVKSGASARLKTLYISSLDAGEITRRLSGHSV